MAFSFLPKLSWQKSKHIIDANLCRAHKGGSSAEVDYMIEKSHGVIPVEVKIGAFGKLKSMRLLLDDNSDIYEGIKVSLDNFKKQNNIQSIPLYAFGSRL